LSTRSQSVARYGETHDELDQAPSTRTLQQADKIASAADAAVHRFVTGAYCVIHVDPSADARLQRTG
jgi:hypothetical protein